MKKSIVLLLSVVALGYAQDVSLDPVEVDATVLSEVSQNAKVSADLGEVLAKDVPSIDMSRRSAIANDVFIRGFKRDNISVTIDGMKIYGACPNRMDPPVSHVLTNNIQSVEVIEGPYDVSEYGNLGGGIKIKTKEPHKGWGGDVSFGGGSWNYQKIAASFDGGDDFLRVLVSASSESSDQYEDGDGNTLAEQVQNYVDASNDPAIAGVRYLPQYEDMKAYTKRSLMTKFYINPMENHELRLSYTANRSDSVMYPNSKMDAYYDDSDIYNVEYEVQNITPWYKSVMVQYYRSKVDHPMGIGYRYSSMMMGNKVNHMWSDMQAVRLKNRFLLSGFVTDVGLEFCKRNWDGSYYLNDNFTGMKSIDDVDTKNYSAYVKVDKKFGALDVSVGARYDKSEVRPDTLPGNDYDSVAANIFANYNINGSNKIFFGLAQAERVPDARELYFRSNGIVLGTPTLDQVTNQEADIGYKFQSDDVDFKIKMFYLMLTNYIYVNADKTANIFENIDATIYGGEVSTSYYVLDDFALEATASYKRGQKDEPLAGQSDKDLADIAPLEGKVGIIYDYMPKSYVRVDVSMRERWNDYDGDNGEQELASWAVVDFKAKHSFNKNIDMTIGVNNILDKTYVRSNTYADLILITSGITEKMILNEPGRYIYANFDLHF